MFGIVDCGPDSGHRNIDVNNPEPTSLKSSRRRF
jgi:hypothetical protein